MIVTELPGDTDPPLFGDTLTEGDAVTVQLPLGSSVRFVMVMVACTPTVTVSVLSEKLRPPSPTVTSTASLPPPPHALRLLAAAASADSWVRKARRCARRGAGAGGSMANGSLLTKRESLRLRTAV